MKKGFTLAEVLITLTIIGVVATLTLPSLMSNTTEQQAITAFRKVMNTLNEAGQMSAATDGFDYSNITTTSKASASAGDVVDANGVAVQSLWALLVNRAQVDVNRSIKGGIGGDCTNKVQVFFRDGTAICFTGTDITQGKGKNADSVINITVDTNGFKAPNALFECTDDNCLKDGKVVGDQFAVTLHGTNAIPGTSTFSKGVETPGANNKDKAARWAMSK